MRSLLTALILMFVISSCKKGDSFDAAAQAAADDAAIQGYISTNKLTNVVKDPSGLYYQIVTAGTGGSPNANSIISVNYSGKYLDGTVFDSGNLNNVALSGLVQGWIIGLPYAKVGGRILLLIPSALGYGHTPTSVRADAVLIFSVDLIGYR